MARKNVKSMQGDRERHKQRILAAPFADSWFTVTDIAAHLRVTVNSVRLYCQQLADDGKLIRDFRDNRAYYRLNTLCLDNYWRVQDNGVLIGQHGFGYAFQ